MTRRVVCQCPALCVLHPKVPYWVGTLLVGMLLGWSLGWLLLRAGR